MDVRAQRKFQDAEALYMQERWAEALVVFDDLSLSYKSDQEVMLRRAMCLARIGKEEEAELLCDHLMIVHHDPRAAQLKVQLPQLKREGKLAPEEITTRPPLFSSEALKRTIVVVFICSALLCGWSFYSAYEAPAPSSIATSPAPSGHTLSFPANIRLGAVFTREWGYSARPEGEHEGTWKTLASAQGKVVIPAGSEVQLVIDPAQIRNLKHLKKLGPNSLQSLSLKDCAAGDADMDYIAHLSGLFALDISNTQVGPEGFGKLYRLTSLREIAMIGTTLGESGRALIASLTYVTSIDADRADLGDEWLMGLPPLQYLTFLSLDEIDEITDTGIIHIAKHSNLKKLFLSYTKMTDKGLEQLQTLTHLDRFWMEGTSITDASMAGFRKTPNIAEIGIANTTVSTEGLMELNGIGTLKKVGIKECKEISLEGARRFALQNPDCFVETDLKL